MTNGEASGDLVDRLAAFGVAKSTGQHLLKQHDPKFVDRWLAYAEHKLVSGWVPRETPAAWLVTALRSGDWIIPDWFHTAEEQQADALVQTKRAAAQQAKADEQAERERRTAQEQRQAIERELGVGERTRETWEQVKELLRERDEFSIAFHSAFLLPLNGRVATIATPVPFFCTVVEKRADALRAAIEAISGKQIETIEAKLLDPTVIASSSAS